jgi:hypothetical protein
MGGMILIFECGILYLIDSESRAALWITFPYCSIGSGDDRYALSRLCHYHCHYHYHSPFSPLLSIHASCPCPVPSLTPAPPALPAVYKSFANSAIAANTLVRSLVGGSFPLFVPAMVRNLGYQSTWSMALLAFLAVGLAGIPFVFARIGERLRGMSKFQAGAVRGGEKRGEHEAGWRKGRF